MKYKRMKLGAIIVTATLSLCVAGCGGSKVLKEPVPFTVTKVLADAADQRLAAALDWVIVRDGPGTWAKNVDWDEYLMRVQNLSDEPIRVTKIVVFDSLGTRIELGGNRRQLVEGSKETTRRYKDEGLKVKAGVGAEAVIIAGGVLFTAGAYVGISMLAGSTGALAASSAGVAAVILGPVLIVGGMVGVAVRSMNNSEVNKHIESRQTPLPAVLPESQKQILDLFFPLAPSPRQIELTYVDSNGEHTLAIDTHSALDGLHLVQVDK